MTYDEMSLGKLLQSLRDAVHNSDWSAVDRISAAIDRGWPRQGDDRTVRVGDPVCQSHGYVAKCCPVCNPRIEAPPTLTIPDDARLRLAVLKEISGRRSPDVTSDAITAAVMGTLRALSASVRR